MTDREINEAREKAYTKNKDAGHIVDLNSALAFKLGFDSAVKLIDRNERRSRFLSWYYFNRSGWFRLFGRGLKWKDTSIHQLIFSERMGHTKGIQIGKWWIIYLRK